MGLIALFLASGRHPWAGDAGTVLPRLLGDGEEEAEAEAEEQVDEQDEWQEDDESVILSRDELVDAGASLRLRLSLRGGCSLSSSSLVCTRTRHSIADTVLAGPCKQQAPGRHATLVWALWYRSCAMCTPG